MLNTDCRYANSPFLVRRERNFCLIFGGAVLIREFESYIEKVAAFQ
jgi:hypothetical protein